jgi:uncharacterized protein YndB with AHSA1/START domain
MTEGASTMTTLDITAEPGTQTIVMTRVFAAPRALVFKAPTDRDLIPKWWGPRRHKTRVDVMDVRPGGSWRYVSRDAEGNEFAFHGVYREIVAPERLAYTFEFEGMPGYVSLETVTFEEHDGKTKLTNTTRFHTVEDRDGMLESGMESGATESMDRLAELLRTMA